MSVIFTECMECAYLYEYKINDKFCCKAFPEGIPKEIFWKQNEDKECNNGIKFKRE